MPSHLIHVTLIQTAHNLTETFSGYERTISENGEEQLLLARWFDLAPVLCGINGMGVGGGSSCECLAMHPCALPFYILVYFTSMHLMLYLRAHSCSVLCFYMHLCLHCMCVVLPHEP